MADFPPLAHVAVTVRDLSVSVPWYEALFGAKPVLDEDTDPDFHHTVYMIGNGTLFGVHQNGTPVPDEKFSEFRAGLDHVSFGCADRADEDRLLGPLHLVERARPHAVGQRLVGRREYRLEALGPIEVEEVGHLVASSLRAWALTTVSTG